MAAVNTLDFAGLALRMVGVFVFVVATVPYGILQPRLIMEDIGMWIIPLIVLAILVLCGHVYLAYRAYYALRRSGLVVFSLVYALIVIYVSHIFGVEWDMQTLRWQAVGYLGLLYGYGVCYNFVDSYVSGLLHTKNV